MWLVKRTGHSFLSLPHNIGTMYIQYFIQTLSEMSRKKLHISKSLIESYQNLNMSEVDKADSFNLCLSYLYWCFLIRIWLETVSQEKALKNLREMKKKEEGSLLPLWRRTVDTIKKILFIKVMAIRIVEPKNQHNQRKFWELG